MFRLDELPKPLFRTRAAKLRDRVADVRPVEARDEGRGIFERKFGDDVLTRALVGRRGERDARHARETLGENFELPVLGAEVVAPLRDAMRFVDREDCNVAALEEAKRALLHETFRRNIEKIEPASRELTLDLVLRRAILCRVEKRRLDAEIAQRIDLILHQRDQRRDDDAGARPDKSGDLIAQRFAAAGRHQRQTIAAAQEGRDDIALQRPKAFVPKDVFERRASRRHLVVCYWQKGQRKRRGNGRHRDILCTGRRSPDANLIRSRGP